MEPGVWGPVGVEDVGFAPVGEEGGGGCEDGADGQEDPARRDGRARAGHGVFWSFFLLSLSFSVVGGAMDV